MSFFSKFLNAVRPAAKSAPRARQPQPAGQHKPTPPTAAATPTHSAVTGRPEPTRNRHPDTADSPGRFGPWRTVEIDPLQVGTVRMSYSPVTDRDPDPGEIVWTWVPFEENDGQGKDRPVLVVAAEPAGTVLAVQLTSKDHDGQIDFIPVGSGEWDSSHWESWANLERVLRVHPDGMRREAAALEEDPFNQVADRLRARYGWS